VKERAISVTEASRKFADCVNRVRYQGITFILEKNGVPVARIVPAHTPAYTIAENPSAESNAADSTTKEDAGHPPVQETAGKPEANPIQAQPLRPPAIW